MLDYLLSFVFLIIGNYLGESPLQVERLLSAEQKATDYRSPDDGMAPDHRPTNACTRFVLLVNFCGVIRNYGCEADWLWNIGNDPSHLPITFCTWS